jgi:hypothetical protein
MTGDRGAGARLIDCADCVMQHTAACDDCVVSFIVGREPGTAIVIDVEEARALRNLSGAGLVPELRHRSRGRATPS